MISGYKIVVPIVTGIAAVGLSIALLDGTRAPPAVREIGLKSPNDKIDNAAAGKQSALLDSPPAADLHPMPSPRNGELNSLAEVPSLDEPSPEVSAEQEAGLRASVLGTMRLMYEDVAGVAGLSSDESEALIGLLAKQQHEIFESEIDPTTVAGAEEHRQLMARHRGEVDALVGKSRATTITNYQKSLDARYQVEELRRQLEAAGMPITEEQRRALIKAAIEKGAYVPTPEFSGGSLDGALGQELLARVQQRDHVMMQVARDLLKPSQAHWYDDYLQRRLAAMDKSLRESMKKRG